MIARRQRRAVFGLFGFLLAANAAAWGWASLAFAGKPDLLATALLAWLLGLRHAVDADHIAAIDNVVRKLMEEGGRPLAVGFYFSLGHSTVVALASAVIAATAASLHGPLLDLHGIGETISTIVSAAFLLAIAVANLIILRAIWRRYRAATRGGTIDDAALADLLSGRGLLARVLRPLLRAVRRSWQMYPLGFLFGLGFDTASEIGLLGIAATQSAQGMSPWQAMVFPALFAAGMALVDTGDSVLMVGAYGWAFVEPLRKLRYNLAMTALSVVVAVGIGGVELLGLVADQLPFVARLNETLGNAGFAVIAIFAAGWGVSALLFSRRRAANPG